MAAEPGARVGAVLRSGWGCWWGEWQCPWEERSQEELWGRGRSALGGDRGL